MDQTPKYVQALFAYSRQHTDELSFQKGDVIKITLQIEGGWWEGELNGTVGWFPSNYVADLSSSDNNGSAAQRNLQTFQQEIVQHILEGEAKQISDLESLVKLFQPNSAVIMKLPRLSKLVAYTDKIVQIISMHEWLAKSLEDMKPLDKPKFVGRLFLEVAATMDSLAGEYAKLYAYVNAGLEENNVLDSIGNEFFSKKTKSQMTSVFDRLERYAVLLRETERYYEEPHPDRPAILKAIQVYTEIIERCALILKLKEADVEILSAEIRGLNEQPLAHFGDPALTMRVRVCTRDSDSGRVVIDAFQPDIILVLFQSFLFVLSCTDAANVHTFRIRLLLTNVRVSVLRDNDKALMIQWPGHHETAADEQLIVSCSDHSSRDLLNATLSDLIDSTVSKAGAVRPATGASSSSTGRLQQQPSPVPPCEAESGAVAAGPTTVAAPVTQPIANSNNSHVLRSLRLDASAAPWANLPNQQPHAGDRFGAAATAVAAVDAGVSGGRASRASQQPHQRSSRPGSPKSGSAAGASGNITHIMRRRRSDRQKSAVSADDILRSAGRLHELNQRAEWDSMILQVVDAYRCSFWQDMTPKPLDLTKLRLSVAEMRQKETSLPPDPSRGQQQRAHCYENAPPEGFRLPGEANEPIRPPPVVLPTRGERRT